MTAIISVSSAGPLWSVCLKNEPQHSLDISDCANLSQSMLGVTIPSLQLIGSALLTACNLLISMAASPEQHVKQGSQRSEALDSSPPPRQLFRSISNRYTFLKVNVNRLKEFEALQFVGVRDSSAVRAVRTQAGEGLASRRLKYHARHLADVSRRPWSGNRLGVNELIEPPGAAPETQPKLAGLAQTEHTLTPTKTALISPLCLAPPVPDPLQPHHETHGGNGCWGQGVRIAGVPFDPLFSPSLLSVAVSFHTHVHKRTADEHPSSNPSQAVFYRSARGTHTSTHPNTLAENPWKKIWSVWTNSLKNAGCAWF
ncbi:hypothetical protein QQF64_033067 [Cirrhinus molitorella]|uniref:Uncharacterized protein n=1 Tax=Cirrhinus molitorella TaxID=172907 RepID=A0ABR3MSV2_9TELE